MLQKISTKIQEIFGFDFRSLAAFRIGLAILFLTDLAIRATDLTAFYTDLGVLPRSVVIERFSLPWNWSLHLISGTTTAAAAIPLDDQLIEIAALLGR